MDFINITCTLTYRNNITMYLEINILYQVPQGNPVLIMFIVMHFI